MKAVPRGRIKYRLLKALKPISGVLHEKPFAVQTKPENGFHPCVLPLELHAFVCSTLTFCMFLL